jgi:hypothetical protein
VGGKPDVDGKHPKLLQHLQDAVFCRDWQREYDEIDARAAAEFHELVDRAEFAFAGDLGLRAFVAPVVEDADDLDARVLLPLIAWMSRPDSKRA